MGYKLAEFEDISIHALREEGDLEHPEKIPAAKISIHALREEGDQRAFFVLVSMCVFLSTPSARRATAKTEKASPLLIKV